MFKPTISHDTIYREYHYVPPSLVARKALQLLVKCCCASAQSLRNRHWLLSAIRFFTLYIALCWFVLGQSRHN